MHGARDQVDVRVRHPCPRGEDVALAIAHHGDHGGICQHGLGLLGGRNPTMRLLVLRTTLLMRDLDPPPARPDPSPTKPRQLPLFASIATMACSSKPRPPPLVLPSPRRRPGMVW